MGIVIFGPDIKNKIRPLKFTKIQKDGTITPVNPKLFKKFLMASESKFIAFSSETDSKEFNPIMEMLENFQFDKEKIKKLTFCKLCLDDNKFTILDKSVKIQSFKNQKICSVCALDIVLREAKLNGLIPTAKRISPKLKNFFNHMILKFQNVSKVLSALKPDFNPVLNKEITIYDIEKSPPISKKYLNQQIEALDIPAAFKIVLINQKISTLLPIQAIAVEHGLLSESANLLIMAPTSGGKTLVGELAGISRAMKEKGRKMLYLVPIVALANIRTEEFKEKYKPLKLKVVKKIGESMFDKKTRTDLNKLTNADVIIATYEAIDYLLRSGKKEVLGDIGTIIIDEIQVLIDPERGFILDGIISRLKVLYESQFLYLSATLGEPKLLAEKLDSKLVRYNNRPVPIERHLLLCQNEAQKQRFISMLVRSSYFKKSKYGFKGQSIIFTNTRKKCESLATYLQAKNINVEPYHSGLTFSERKVVENKFLTQKITGVVATAALAAGVDLPARQIIFESLAMGINWLTVAEFEQMIGRAGRLKKHERGYAYVLVEPGKIYSPKMKNITEENMAMKLLNGKIKDFQQIPHEFRSLTELLAFISIYNEGVIIDEIIHYYELLINNDYEIGRFLKKLNRLNLISVKEGSIYKATRLGQAISKSFFLIDLCLEIIEILKLKEKPIIEIALELKPIKNIYLSRRIVADLAKNVNMRYFSNNFFSASVLSLMNAENIKKRKNFSQEFIKFISKWVSHIFNCKCKDNPYCDCGRLNLEKLILNLKAEQKFSIEEISKYLEMEFEIVMFKGDIIDYLENLIYTFESIKNISEGISNLDSNYVKEISEIPLIISNIKN